MTRKNKVQTWKKYMSGKDSGFYILDNKRNEAVYYGPFKSKEFAEFFNFIAFGSPRDMQAGEGAKSGIVFCEKAPINREHPRIMFASNSKFGLWFSDLYGKPLTTKLILALAQECGAKGYKSFTNWIIAGSKINGVHLGSLEFNWQ